MVPLCAADVPLQHRLPETLHAWPALRACSASQPMIKLTFAQIVVVIIQAQVIAKPWPVCRCIAAGHVAYMTDSMSAAALRAASLARASFRLARTAIIAFVVTKRLIADISRQVSSPLHSCTDTRVAAEASRSSTGNRPLLPAHQS